MVTVEGNATVLGGESEEREPDPVISAARMPGEQVGRYLLVEMIGRGGMGVVYSAYDPELDRKVALKLVRPDAGKSATGVRLMREAQAMARLSHENVITVHDVGRLEDGAVFIAMEFIEGPTLADWQHQPGRRWSEILEVYIKAGQGLAAAHDAQLVHRDFKPENVLLGSAGRVRVLDFGLARQDLASGEHAPPSSGVVLDSGVRLEPSADTLAGSQPVASRFSLGEETHAGLTRTGALVGTPAYMAPEQHAGGHVDFRSDQFAYCVALWEAIYGERPFAGESLTAIAFAVLSGELRDSPSGSDVPDKVRRALARGLATEPDGRFESMHALLAELEPQESKASMGLLVTLGALSIGLAASLGFALADLGEKAPCEDVDRDLKAFWNPSRIQQAGQAFEDTGVPFAGDAWARARRGVDDWARDWSAARVHACEATRVRGEQSETLMDLRMACLNRRLGEVRTVVGRFAGADVRTVENAAKAVEDLPSIDLCSDTEALVAMVAPPSDPAKAQAVEEIRSKLEGAAGANSAGDLEAAKKMGEDALGEARLVGYEPIVATAGIVVGGLRAAAYDFDGAEEALGLAVLASEATGDARTGARAWIEVLGVRGTEQFEMKGAHEAARHAAAYLQRFGETDPMRADYLQYYAGVLEWEGKYREAIAENEKSLAIHVKNDGEVSLAASAIYTAIGNEHWELGELDEALRLHEKAYALDLEILGPAHPSVADSLSNIGIIHDERGDFRKARELYQRSIDIVKAAGRDDAGSLAVYHNNIASTFLEEGDWVEAGRNYDIALEQWTRAYGTKHPDVAMALTNLAIIDEHEGDLASALDKYDRSIEIHVAHFGAKHREVAWARAARADILRLMGRLGEAREELRGAIELSIVAVGADHEDVAQARVHLGRVFMDLGLWQEAQMQFEQVVENRQRRLKADHQSVIRARGMAAVARLETGDSEGARPELRAVTEALRVHSAEDDSHAMIHFAHARSIADDDPSGARAAAGRAMAFYGDAPPHFERERGRVSAFLKQL
jgi:serine/threonine protein kinase/tetratricopeptide (TPR) repeat protein